MDSIVNRLAVGLLAMSIAINAYADGNALATRPHKSIERIMSKSSDYATQYADAAMEQMRRYGIPASVTLAQGILESANGQSELSRKGNNHFGIKATSSWLDNGGKYLVYTDDKPNEKFCQYASVEDSYEHHSLFLKSNSRYADLFKLSADDYVGWTRGLQNAGYATSKQYAASLQSIIKANGLDKYDRMVMQQQGWQSSQSQVSSTAQLAANSKGADTADQGQKQSQPQLQEDKKQATEQTNPKGKDYFNTIQAYAENDEDPWKSLLGTGANSFGTDPIVEMASTMFAGLMAIAMQIDNMGNAQEVQLQDNPLQTQASSEASALAAQNFENSMNSLNNNTIKRTRS